MNEVLTYEALKAERDALSVENANQRDWMNKCSELWDAGCELDDLLGLMPETPATSAALAAIRTDSHIAGLEAAANRIGVISRNYKPGQKQELIKAIGRDVLQYAIELREAK